MIKLIWFVAFIHAQAGPQVVAVQDSEKLKDEEQCTLYGEAMKDRFADYARGAAHLTWQDKVAVQFKCEPDGDPL